VIRTRLVAVSRGPGDQGLAVRDVLRLSVGLQGTILRLVAQECLFQLPCFLRSRGDILLQGTCPALAAGLRLCPRGRVASVRRQEKFLGLAASLLVDLLYRRPRPISSTLLVVVPTTCRRPGRITEKISLTRTVLPPPFSRNKTVAGDGRPSGSRRKSSMTSWYLAPLGPTAWRRTRDSSYTGDLRGCRRNGAQAAARVGHRDYVEGEQLGEGSFGGQFPHLDLIPGSCSVGAAVIVIHLG
jgi:hypothetical protein